MGTKKRPKVADSPLSIIINDPISTFFYRNEDLGYKKKENKNKMNARAKTLELKKNSIARNPYLSKLLLRLR